MSDAELAALAALVHAEAVEREGCIRQFGERPWDWRTPAVTALEVEIERRGIASTAPSWSPPND
jgi:hypothetical protein